MIRVAAEYLEQAVALQTSSGACPSEEHNRHQRLVCTYLVIHLDTMELGVLLSHCIRSRSSVYGSHSNSRHAS